MARPSRRPGNLPAETTSFIGRRRELAELRAKLGAARLVSLVGPGGVGKTRVAIRGAVDLARRFADGAWLVEFADVQDPALVASSVLSALDLRHQTAIEPRALLLSYLRGKRLLLVVDNCEHLLEPIALLVAEILSGAQGVFVLATSREPLSVAGEHVMPIPPLELPSADVAEPLTRARQNEAVALFTERAADASGAFELTVSNQAAVVEVCRRLDGVPLAIELAAVRTRALAVEQIRDRLTDRFVLLTGGSRAALPRHQTLRTTIDWSHDLLDCAERTLLRRLSVFAARFSLETIESICALEGVTPSNTVAVLSSLVDKSLVMKEDVTGRASYRLHETMREYARLRLRDAGEEEVIELRCTDYYVATCRASAAQARYQLPAWLEWIELEIDTIRSVLRRLLRAGDLQRGIDLASALTYYWITRATTEGVQWLDAFLALADQNTPRLAWPCHIRGFLGVLQSDPLAARPALERAVAGAREIGPTTLLVQALAMASIAEMMAEDRAASRRLLDQAQLVAAGVDDMPATLMVLQARAMNGLFEGDLDIVSAASAEGAQLSEHIGDVYSLEMMLINQGMVSLLEQHLGSAKSSLTQALRIAQQIDDRVAQYYILDALGCVAVGLRQARVGVQLFGAAESLRTGAGASMVALLAPLMARAEESATATLGASRFRAEFDVGTRLDRRAAIAVALGKAERESASAQELLGPLGIREGEVAQLVADGLSNKQIGARLLISERTVDSHVRSIMNKLGFNSRAQIAGWVRSSDR